MVKVTSFLIALVVLVGAVAVLNLLLTVGVIRRLRQHTEKLTNLPVPDGTAPSVMPGAGEQVDDFTATTDDGQPVSRDLLSGQTLIGVLSPSCSACEERLPEFLVRAKEFPGGRGQVLAVLAGEREETAEYRERLAPVARLVIEPLLDGPVAAALKVQGYPAFAVLDSTGTVVASGHDPHQLRLPAPAVA